MTVVKVAPPRRLPRSVRAALALAVAIAIAVVAAWSPSVAIAAGVFVAVAGLLLEVLIWTSKDDDSNP